MISSASSYVISSACTIRSRLPCSFHDLRTLLDSATEIRPAILSIVGSRPRVMIASMLNNPNIHGNAKIRQGTIPAIDISNCLLTLCDVPCVSEALRSLLVPSDVSNSTYIMRQCRGHPIELYVSAIRQQRSTKQYSRSKAFNQNDRYT